MSGAKHTPGPWRVEQDTTLIWGACDADDQTTYGMGYPIAEARISPISMGWAKGPSEDEGEANARLIAASPDLLEALRTKRDYVADAANGSLTYEGSGNGFKAMALEDLARIDAVIAKAEGRS